METPPDPWQLEEHTLLHDASKAFGWCFFASTLCWKNLSYLRIEFLIESVGGQKALSWALDFSGCLLSHVIIQMDCDKHA